LGKVTFTLYGPFTGTVTSTSCNSTAPIAFKVTVATSDNPLLQGSAHYSSGNTTASAAGTYAWVASYLGNAGNNPATSGCTSELVTVVGGGLIAPTNTTCQNFTSSSPENPAFDLDATNYTVSAGKIANVTPGVFFYYSQIKAPSNSFTVNITEANDANNTNPPSTTNAYNFGVLNGSTNQVQLYNADCTTLSGATAPVTISGTNGSQVSVNISGTNITGKIIIIGVKYQSKSIVGATAPNPTTVNYGFKTVIGGVVQSTDAGGLQLIKSP
jgi:hypothetical protein